MIRFLAWAGMILLSALLGVVIVVGLGVVLLTIEAIWHG